MKKLPLVLALAALLTATIVVPIQAAPPNEEEWTFGEARNGLIRATYFINTTTLKTSSFNFYNETTDVYAIPYVLQNGVEIWRHTVSPQSTYNQAFVVNFQRIPKNDPDDPDSIRYPAGYTFGMWTGANPNNYP